MIVKLRRVTVRILPGQLYNTPERQTSDSPIADLPTYTAEIPENTTLDNVVSDALAVLDADARLIPYWDSEVGLRRVDWSVRKASVGPIDAQVGDYVRHYRVWEIWLHQEETVRTRRLQSRGSIPLDVLDAASTAGYMDADWYDILLWQAEGGWGGGDGLFDWAGFLLDHGVDLALGAGVPYVTHYAGKVFRTKRHDAKARRQAAIWDARGFHNGAILRSWFDTKHEWDIAEVGKRLDLSMLAARALLKALGYESLSRDFGKWRLSPKKRAVKRREAWTKGEFG